MKIKWCKGLALSFVPLSLLFPFAITSCSKPPHIYENTIILDREYGSIDGDNRMSVSVSAIIEKTITGDVVNDNVNWSIPDGLSDYVDIVQNHDFITFTHKNVTRSSKTWEIEASYPKSESVFFSLNLSRYTQKNYEYKIVCDGNPFNKTLTQTIDTLTVSAKIYTKDNQLDNTKFCEFEQRQKSQWPYYVTCDTNTPNQATITLTKDVSTIYQDLVLEIHCMDNGIDIADPIFITIKVDKYTPKENWDDAWIKHDDFNIDNKGALHGFKSSANYSDVKYTTLHIPWEVTSIQTEAFAFAVNENTKINNNNIKKFEFGAAKVQEVGAYAFTNAPFCGELLTPSTLTTIGQYAFDSVQFSVIDISNSTGLSTLKIGTFSEDNKLETIFLNEGLKEIQDGSGARNNGVFQCGGASILKGQLTFPSTLEKIGTCAFARYPANYGQGLENLIVNWNNCSKLKVISTGAFDNLANLIGPNGLGTIVIPDSVVQLGAAQIQQKGYSFYGCIRLTNVTISKNVTYPGNAVFAGCTNLEQVTIKSQSIYQYSDNYYGELWGKWLDGTKIRGGVGKVWVPSTVYDTYHNRTGLASGWPTEVQFDRIP